MTTVILTWQGNPLAFKFALDLDSRSGDYGAIQRELIPVLRSIPFLSFDYKTARFEFSDREAGIKMLISSLAGAGYAVLHKGEVPPEIEEPQRPN